MSAVTTTRAAGRALALLAAFLAVCAGCARRAAGEGQEAALYTAEDGSCTAFQCADGGCVWNGSRCDGVKQCQDSSDESWETCKTPGMVLEVTSVKPVRVHFEHAHNAVVLLLCDGLDCAALWLWGATAAAAPRAAPGTAGAPPPPAEKPGELRYEAWTGCGLVGFPCKAKQKEEVPDDWEPFPEGPLDLHVERNPPFVRVWLNGSKYKAEVVTKDGQTQLKVRPYNWVTDMLVEFLSTRRY